MNTLTTFTGLAAEIPIWTRRNDTDFLNEVQNFINLAQQKIFIDCPTMASQQYITGSFTPNNNVVSVPSLWGSNLTFEYLNTVTQDITVLQYAPYEYLKSYNPSADGVSTQTIYPRYYSNMGIGYLIIAPTPIAAYPFQIAYDANNPQLSSSTQTNFITQQMYDLLFIGSLYYAYIFLENDAQTQKYEDMYNKRLQGYKAYNSGRKSDRNDDAQKD